MSIAAKQSPISATAEHLYHTVPKHCAATAVIVEMPMLSAEFG